MSVNLAPGMYPFWDEYLTDTRFTDAVLSVNRPDRAGNVFTADAPWEGNNSCSFSVVRDGDVYRMYYEGRDWPESHPTVICCAESSDGLNWVRPSYGLVEFGGSRDNNIILDEKVGGPFCMLDENPDCPPSARIKMFVGQHYDCEEGHRIRMLCYVSGDGVHFAKSHEFITPEYIRNMYDSVNTVYWDKRDKKYYCFFRTLHFKPTNTEKQFEESYARAIMVMTSEDCVNWSAAQPVDFLGGDDYQLYSNCVTPYLYDDSYYVGFPTRYNERFEWDASFERLTAKEMRLKRMMKDGKIDDSVKRQGLAVTDCLFMSSRDKVRWFRFDEAALTPGPEDGYNWEYGDCYPAIGMFETPGRFSPEPEITLLCESHHWTDAPVELIRYVYRRDGFASYKAGYKPKTLRTKPFVLGGGALKLNFRTSARGYVCVSVLDGYSNAIEGCISCPHFGDTVQRIIDFDKPLSELKGSTVKLEFIMSDAEIYSMTIE